jgi:hypothetical protein
VRRAIGPLVVLLGVGLLAWTTLRGSDVSCQVCVASGSLRQCGTVSAETREAALAAAHAKACGVLSNSVTSDLACQRVAPASVDCRE